MSKILNFQTDQGPFSIQLIDTEFVDFWLAHFIKISQSYALNPRYNDWPYYTTDHTGAELIATRIISTIDTINALDYVNALPEYCTFESLMQLDLNTQLLLNRLHRYAVVGSEIRDRWIMDQEPQHDWIPWDNEHYSYLLDLLNQSIHCLEEFIETPRKKQYAWDPIKNRVHSICTSLEVLVDASRYQDIDVYQNNVDCAIPEHMQKYLRTSGFDVWIKKDLLGKDFITAFIDHDDADNFDIRPPTIISGAFQIHLNQGRDQVISDPKFQQWMLASPNSHCGNYPLGNVILGKENLLRMGNLVNKIELESIGTGQF